MSAFAPLTDSEWGSLEPLFSEPRRMRPGKPHTPWRAVLNSVLFVVKTGTKWSALPEGMEFASKSAANRWFILWERSGFLKQVLEKLNVVMQLPKRRTRAVETVS